MSSRDNRRDDELEERLDELEDVLTDLRRDLRESGRDRRESPRPPSLSELLRFTEQYTIPTVIALLETTIKSLELLRGTLRLADPGRSVADDAGATADRLADVRDGASAGLARSLAELRTALTEADLPEEAASRSIITEARDLTAEIESRIEESRRAADDARRPNRRDDARRSRSDRDPGDGHDATGRDRGIQIDVTDPDAEPEDDDPEVDPAPEVDVESELESIKRQIDVDEADAAREDADEPDSADGEAGDGEGDDRNGDAAEPASSDDAEDVDDPDDADRDAN